MNAALLESDRNTDDPSPKDTAHQAFVKKNALHTLDGATARREHTYTHTNTTDGSETTTRIDDFLINRSPESPSVEVIHQGTLSDHSPILAIIPTKCLEAYIPAARPPAPPPAPTTHLVTPISQADRIALQTRLASHSGGIATTTASLHSDLSHILSTEIHPYFRRIEDENGKSPNRLATISGETAVEAVNALAERSTTILQQAHAIAKQVCHTKIVNQGGKHYRRRAEEKKRKQLRKQVKSLRAIRSKANVLGTPREGSAPHVMSTRWGAYKALYERAPLQVRAVADLVSGLQAAGDKSIGEACRAACAACAFEDNQMLMHAGDHFWGSMETAIGAVLMQTDAESAVCAMARALTATLTQRTIDLHVVKDPEAASRQTASQRYGLGSQVQPRPAIPLDGPAAPWGGYSSSSGMQASPSRPPPPPMQPMQRPPAGDSTAAAGPSASKQQAPSGGHAYAGVPDHAAPPTRQVRKGRRRGKRGGRRQRARRQQPTGQSAAPKGAAAPQAAVAVRAVECLAQVALAALGALQSSQHRGLPPTRQGGPRQRQQTAPRPSTAASAPPPPPPPARAAQAAPHAKPPPKARQQPAPPRPSTAAVPPVRRPATAGAAQASAMDQDALSRIKRERSRSRSPGTESWASMVEFGR
jgi:hypothetical protein